jgi:hypothetical protein
LAIGGLNVILHRLQQRKALFQRQHLGQCFLRLGCLDILGGIVLKIIPFIYQIAVYSFDRREKRVGGIRCLRCGDCRQRESNGENKTRLFY